MKTKEPILTAEEEEIAEITRQTLEHLDYIAQIPKVIATFEDA